MFTSFFDEVEKYVTQHRVENEEEAKERVLAALKIDDILLHTWLLLFSSSSSELFLSAPRSTCVCQNVCGICACFSSFSYFFSWCMLHSYVCTCVSLRNCSVGWKRRVKFHNSISTFSYTNIIWLIQNYLWPKYLGMQGYRLWFYQ